MSEHTRAVTRRRLVQGAAWSVPAITIAAPAVAATCSPASPCTPVSLEGAWKVPGSSCPGYPKGYVMAFKVCNTTSGPVAVGGFRLSRTLVDGEPVGFQLTGGATTTLAAGECKVLWFGTDGFPNSHARSISGTVTWRVTAGSTARTESFSFADVPAGTPYPGPGKCPPLGATGGI